MPASFSIANSTYLLQSYFQQL